MHAVDTSKNEMDAAAQIAQLQAENQALRTLLTQNNISIPPNLVPAAAAPASSALSQFGGAVLKTLQPFAAQAAQSAAQIGTAAATSALQGGDPRLAAKGAAVQQLQTYAQQRPSMLAPVPQAQPPQYYRMQ